MIFRPDLLSFLEGGGFVTDGMLRLLLPMVLLTAALQIFFLMRKASGRNTSSSQDLEMPEYHAQSSSVPERDELDDATLDKAESYLAIGETPELVYRFINPNFAGWSEARKEAYGQQVQARLAERR